MWLKKGLKGGKNGILKTGSHTSYTQVFKVSKQHKGGKNGILKTGSHTSYTQVFKVSKQHRIEMSSF